MPVAASAPRPTPSVTDEALAAALIGGEDAAFDQIVRRWRDRVVDLSSLILGDRHLAEDVGQEVFIRILKRPQAYDPTRPFAAWIMTVTRNLCFDKRRREGARSKHQKVAVEERRFGPEAEVAPLDAAVSSEGRELLQKAILELAPPFREVYVMCAVRGMSYEEAAIVCGCGVKTVSTRLARARKRLLERMRGWL